MTMIFEYSSNWETKNRWKRMREREREKKKTTEMHKETEQ